MWAYIDGVVKQDGDRYYVQSFINPSPWSFAFNFPGDKLMQGLQRDRPNPIPLTKSIKDLIESLEAEVKIHLNSAKAYFSLAIVNRRGMIAWF